MPVVPAWTVAFAVAFAPPPPQISMGAARAALDASTPPVEPPAPSVAPEPKPPKDKKTRARELPPHLASPIRVRWAIDSAVIASAVVPYSVLAHHYGPKQEASAPSGPPDIGRFDRAAMGHYRPKLSHVSDGLLAASIALPPIMHAVESGVYAAKADKPGRTFVSRYAADLMMYGEAIAIDLLTVKVIKLAVRRHRPFTHLEPSAVPDNVAGHLVRAQENPSSSESFPSGHASLAFTAATAGATLLTLKHGREHPGLVTAVWLTSTSLAATTSALRVVAGKHYPTDVLVGSLIGAAIGVVVPLAHAHTLRRRRPGEEPRTWQASLRPSFDLHGGGGATFTMQW